MAHWPYNTAAWKRLRAAKLQMAPNCEMHERLGEIVAAHAVDHVVPISSGGAAFPAFDGLMSLCESCHNEKTNRFDRQGGNASGRRFKGCDERGNPIDPADGWNTGTTALPRKMYSIPFGLKPSRVPVVIVSGPPAAGKTTYARSIARACDIVIDLDECIARAGGQPWSWNLAPHVKRAAFAARDEQIRSLAKRSEGQAVLIVSAPTRDERDLWVHVLHRATVTVIDTPEEECVRRILSDPLRAEYADQLRAAVRSWWSKYDP